ncbi:hypothetical protein NA57DRAFT_72132 [Rhizodiscina lignyota]|uniref:EamA domain-containing protein n=1 Tax=Rhizodiscina lignyota TaxID=1504668 RepID=A0A9P4MAD6_9PEZI|nr:hypothetical protein NA57DRAFT_72132 [Rhizodiscina lignyota]
MDVPKSARPWLVLAISSGACAAFNGVFAKLTTTSLTSSWAGSIASGLHLSPENKLVEYAVRGTMFLFNLLFNAIMWALFTRALTLAPSAIRVNVLNTASNFLITAVVGLLVFSEALPALWFLGAAMLVAGSVIIGAREEKGQNKVEAHEEPLMGVGADGVELDGAVNDNVDTDARGRGTASSDIPGEERGSRERDGSKRRRHREEESEPYRDEE